MFRMMWKRSSTWTAAGIFTQLRSKVKRGMDDAFRRGDNISPPGVGYRLVEVKDANGNLVITHKHTIEKVVEIDPEAADWTRRGAEMIAYEGQSAIDVARLFNEHEGGCEQTWSDGRARQHYSRPRLVGKDILHMTKHVVNRNTGKKRTVRLPEKDWMYRDVPHLRILPDDLAEAVRQKLGLGAESFGRKAKDRTKKAHRARGDRPAADSFDKEARAGDRERGPAARAAD
jgi:hypothetical protein